MAQKAILGVDGGNTKTDLALFGVDGTLLNWIHVGTCSHENVPGSYDGAAAALDGFINQLADISRCNIVAAVMGLAGIDTQLQQREMVRATELLHIEQRILVNDAFPTIKAVSPNGTGICCSCGTGVVTGGIDEQGKMVQVGGIGQVSGDHAGGSYFAADALSAVYAACMQNGPATSMTAPVCELLGMDDPELLMDAMMVRHARNSDVVFTQTLFAHAALGDAVALGIVRLRAEEMADSVIGCWRRLAFAGPVHIVQSGTLWAKIEQPQMRDFFEARVKAYVDQPVVFHRMVSAPPVAGACCWAMQLALGHPLLDADRNAMVGQFARQAESIPPIVNC